MHAPSDQIRALLYSVQEYKGQPLVSIREYYTDKETGELKPTKKGVSLTTEQWRLIKEIMADVDGALAQGSTGDKDPKKKKARQAADDGGDD